MEQVTKKQVLKVAGEFWKRWGYMTMYKTKKEYITKHVIPSLEKWKKEGDKFLEQRTENTVDDLKQRELQVSDYLKRAKDIEKIDKKIKEGLEKTNDRKTRNKN